jgi:hypothetical protein
VLGYALAEDGMRVVLDQNTDFQFEYFIEYIDRFRFKDTFYQKDLLDLYRNSRGSQ